jgi:large subunit ribosomal protein L25
MELRKFKAYKRTELGKNSNRKLRNTGMVSGILYGKGQDQVNLKFNPKKLIEALDPEKKRNTFFQLDVEEGNSETVIVRDVQIDALSGKIKHIDFFRIDATDHISVKVPFKVIGTSLGEKIGGVVRQVLTVLPIKCEVAKIPASIIYDVSKMVIGDVARVQDLTTSDDLIIKMTDRQAVVFCSTARIIEEEVDEDEEEGAETTEEGEAAKTEATTA